MSNWFKHNVLSFKGDVILYSCVLILCGFSCMYGFSASSNLAYRLNDGNIYPFGFKHFLSILMGFFVLWFTANQKKLSYCDYLPLFSKLFFCSIGLLVLTFISGKTINGSQRWIFGIQPSDVTKVMIIIHLSWKLLKLKEYDTRQIWLNLFMPVLLAVGLILPSDLSTAGLLFASCQALFIVVGVKFKYFVQLFVVLGSLVAFVLVLNMEFPKLLPRVGTWQKRIEGFLESNNAQFNKKENYQATMAKMAIYNGGIVGENAGRGSVKNGLYSSQSDFIYASIIEEFGLVGGVICIVLYLTIFWRCILLCKSERIRSVDRFMVFGLSFMFILQAFINMGVGVNLLPVTGQALPLISMGGTSILFNCFALGIILNISLYEKSKSN